jgi:hypothetical protein
MQHLKAVYSFWYMYILILNDNTLNKNEDD